MPTTPDAEGLALTEEEPLLISAMRRADQYDDVRIRTLGTSIGGFLREYDECLAARVRAARAEGAREALVEAADAADSPGGLARPSNVGGDWLDGACDVIAFLRDRADAVGGAE